MRAVLFVLDGFGVGDAPDAAAFRPPGSPEANTGGHIQEAVRDLELPTLFSLGLGEILAGRVFDPPARKTTGCYGRMRPRSAGNDTISGHWELAGVITETPFATFSSFPEELVAAIAEEAGVRFLGNTTGSTAALLEAYGEEHLRTGDPILYTTASSAFQIAAHTARVPLGRLYEIGRIARRHCDDRRIGRVIVKPFAGEPGHWAEAPGRHDYPIAPPHTILNTIAEAGLPVEGVGKISDLFAHSGVTRNHRTASNRESLETVARLWPLAPDALLLVNLGDFDTLYGHRRDPVGFARALEQFDDWLADFLEEADSDDLVLITADHGNDPTAPGTDHTREEVPILARYDGRTGPLGIRESFADVAATLAAFFDLDRRYPGGQLPGEPLLSFYRPRGFPIPR